MKAKVASMNCSAAPAKVLLFGEHFVVKGRPALGLAVAVYAKVCVKRGSGRISSRQLGTIKEDSTHSLLFSTLLRVVDEIYGPLPKFDIEVDSNIPIASGMGSSASVSVALAHAILTATGVNFTREDVRMIAHEAEKAVHYRPSGVDTSIATYGGLLYYRHGQLNRLNLKLPGDVSLIIVNTGVERSTGDVVKDVLSRYERLGAIAEYIYSAGESIVEKAIGLIEAGDVKALGELMSVNHGLLWAMGASSKACDDVVYELLKHGAYGGKLSGAGRGGIVIGLISRELAELAKRVLSDKGYKCIIAEPDYTGVKSL